MPGQHIVRRQVAAVPPFLDRCRCGAIYRQRRRTRIRNIEVNRNRVPGCRRERWSSRARIGISAIRCCARARDGLVVRRCRSRLCARVRRQQIGRRGHRSAIYFAHRRRALRPRHVAAQAACKTRRRPPVAFATAVAPIALTICAAVAAAGGAFACQYPSPVNGVTPPNVVLLPLWL